MGSRLGYLAPVAVVGASLAFAAPASALTFVSASGVFSGPAGTTVEPPIITPPAAKSLDPLPGGGVQTGPNGIRWGTSSGSGRSGVRLYGSNYAGAPGGGLSIPVDGTDLVVGQLFEFDHINFPVSGTIPNTVNLTFTFNFIDQNNVPTVVVTPAIPVTIEETANDPPCPSFQLSAVPCDDRISLTQPSIQFFPVNTPKGNEFLVLELEFQQLAGPTCPTGQSCVVTTEGQQNFFDIDGTFRVAPAPLPFGAAGALSLFAVGIGRLRKRYSAVTSVAD